MNFTFEPTEIQQETIKNLINGMIDCIIQQEIEKAEKEVVRRIGEVMPKIKTEVLKVFNYQTNHQCINIIIEMLLKENIANEDFEHRVQEVLENLHTWRPGHDGECTILLAGLLSELEELKKLSKKR
jgi:Flp pilus assembly CpaF family ATPase